MSTPGHVSAGKVLPRGAEPERVTVVPRATAVQLESYLDSGTQVDQFELIRELGRGGMGQVFLARDTWLGRLVALKFLSLRSPARIERFLVEARATARCDHDNIVVIYEASEWRGIPYLALEYLEGQSLAQLLEGGTMAPRRAVELMIHVVHALERAHELGIVHRDLKPDNIFVTQSGQVKVLDFGIATLFEQPETQGSALLGEAERTEANALVGTMPYMAPEQWAAGAVGDKADLWAVGIVLWKMLAGRHPLDQPTIATLRQSAAQLDQPMPRIEGHVANLPAELGALVDACLAKRPQERPASATELSAALALLVPRAQYRAGHDEDPYPGLLAFRERDANVFFGRTREIEQLVQRLREQPLVGIVAPSGVGKSSFVQAGVVPALKASDEPWEVFSTRPGRKPFERLASLLLPITDSSETDIAMQAAELRALADRLKNEPGVLGALLRARARRKQGRILLFVDQFEELYTLVEDPAERHAYAACLAAVADAPSTPLRVVFAMRSDLLDRVAAHQLFMDRFTVNLMFLASIDRDAMRAALVEPLHAVGYGFESPRIVDEMLTVLDGTPGALPLLQFTAGKLWSERDQDKRLLTVASYEAIGGVAGVLAGHADQFLASLTSQQRALVRSIFERLVTSNGTRTVADMSELDTLSPVHGVSRTLVDRLVDARLLVVHRNNNEAGATVEIVHESLIETWPTLRRWREARVEDSAFLDELRVAAKQWDSKDRDPGLIWRDDAARESVRFSRRYSDALPSREQDFLQAVVRLQSRVRRRRHRLLVAAFASMALIVIAAIVALVWIRDAERTAQTHRKAAVEEAVRARNAEADVREKLGTIEAQKQTLRTAESRRRAANNIANSASEKARQSEDRAKSAETKRKLTYAQLEAVLGEARRARNRATAAASRAVQLAESERAAKRALDKLVAEKQRRIKQLERDKRALQDTLN